MSRNLSMYSTTRLRNVRDLIVETDNGDAGLDLLRFDIDIEIDRRRENYRLGSSSFINMPGFMRVLLDAYRSPSDRAWSITCLTDGWVGVSRPAAIALLSKAVPFKVEGDAVVFDYVREEA